MSKSKKIISKRSAVKWANIINMGIMYFINKNTIFFSTQHYI